MSQYHAPLADIHFVLNELAGLEQVASLPGNEEATPDVAVAILEEAAKFATNVLDPLNASGDREGAQRRDDGTVTTPAGFRDAYHQFCENGWNGLGKSTEFGGQGLPYLLSIAVEELWHASNLAFDLCPLLTQGRDRGDRIARLGCAEAEVPAEDGRRHVDRHDESHRAAGRLGSRRRPHEGGPARRRHVPAVFGQKVFITYGEHDYTDNIIHLVLGRTPDAPPGVKGISLFVVPKFIVNDDGSLGARNDVHCVSLEHKLGIHASPTGVMVYGDHGGAVGYLVGEENRGLEYMFIMMNLARFSVGLEGVGISERAYQHAVAYARERVQGRPVGLEGAAKSAPIIDHPDIRRILMTMRATVEAMRAVAYVTAAAVDNAHRQSDAAARARHQAFVDFMIPIVKGCSTENAQRLTSLGLQVHGGMGFIEETGAAQYYRDARITTIYEGTTGIQANDFIGRKTARDGGAEARRVAAEIDKVAAELAAHPDANLKAIGTRLARAVKSLHVALEWMVPAFGTNARAAHASAVPYLELWGLVAGGWQMGRAALVAARHLKEGAGDARFLTAKIQTARFYADALLPQATGLADIVTAGGEPAMALAAEQF